MLKNVQLNSNHMHTTMQPHNVHSIHSYQASLTVLKYLDI